MLLVTYYAFNYANIIGLGLAVSWQVKIPISGMDSSCLNIATYLKVIYSYGYTHNSVTFKI